MEKQQYFAGVFRAADAAPISLLVDRRINRAAVRDLGEFAPTQHLTLAALRQRRASVLGILAEWEGDPEVAERVRSRRIELEGLFRNGGLSD